MHRSISAFGALWHTKYNDIELAFIVEGNGGTGKILRYRINSIGDYRNPMWRPN